MDFNSKIRIAIISDPHFYQPEKGHPAPSWININEIHHDNSLWKQLTDLITKENLCADVLLSLGDITTFANQQALNVAWQAHIKLGQQLGCELLAGATGNHDVCSRPEEGGITPREMEKATDLFENLKQLKPCYPIHFYRDSDQAKLHQYRIHYFGADFVVYDEDPRFRIVIINSCARHTTEPKEHERGRIAASTMDWLDNELKKFSEQPKKINIAICHHNPLPLEDNNAGTYDVIQNGQIFLDRLNACGDWIVCHGHKHFPKITDRNDSFIFSSASLGSHSASENNQFYILELYMPDIGSLVCSVNAWNWFERKGWEKALSVNNSVWHGCGFGVKRHPDEIAKTISQLPDGFPVDWNTARERCPELKFLTPEKFKKVIQALKSKYQLNIVCTENGPVEIARTLS